MDQAPQITPAAPSAIQSLRAARDGLKIKLAESRGEWAQIEFLFEQWGEPAPDPQRAFVAIALDAGGRVVALQVMQFVLHAEPLWVAPEWRGKFNVLRLLKALEHHLQSILPFGFTYHIMATRRNIERLATLAGMSLLGPVTMFRKTVFPESAGSAENAGSAKEKGEVA